MLRLLLLLLLVPSSLLAIEMEDLFPPAPLTPAQAEALLTADRIGPPATMFDTRTTTPEAAGPQILAIEEEAFGKRAEGLVAPDALRRYGQTMIDVRMAGRPSVATMLFVADHVGLPHVPSEILRFAVGGKELDADRVIAQVRKHVDLGSLDGARLAVTLRPVPEHDVWAGIVWRFEVEPELDPFPRTFTPGKLVQLPGAQADDKTLYALYMTLPGTDSVELPIEVEGGRFTLEVTMPHEPGIYRVAVASQKKNRMPDSPFFFSLYVGTELPTEYRSPLPKGSDPDTLALDDWERALLVGVNAERAAHDLSAAELRPSGTERMREILARAPKRSHAAWRYLRRVIREDPLPDEPHGLWQASFPQGQAPEEALWLAFENPISRSTLLDPDVETVAMGAGPTEWGGHEVLIVAMAAAPTAESAAEVVFAEMQAKAPRTLEVPPKLEAELDALAAEVAAGKTSFKAATGPIKKMLRQKMVRGDYKVYTQAVPPGQAPELDDYELPSFVKYLAIGDAVGDLGRGDGLQWTVLLVILAQHAQ